MEFTIYRDLASVAFVRCTSPIPGSRFSAEGTGFTVSRAIAKCRSERIERTFQRSHPERDRMQGIAAHPESAASEENALNEAIETLVFRGLAISPHFFGLSFPFFGTRIFLGRVNDRYISLARFQADGTPTATQSVGQNPISVLLKVWTEVRNLRLYFPKSSGLESYTKANRLLTAEQIAKISAESPWRVNLVKIASLKKFQAKENSHYITYFTQETQE